MNKAEQDLIKKHFPYKSNYISIAGHQMHYIDEGNGDVVLLLHGNPTWSFFYRSVIEKLKDQYRVIAPDFIGMGLSDHPKDTRLRASDRIDNLQEFIDSLNLEKFSLVMHDWGGSIGTGLAVRNVERIQRIVYLNTTLTVTESLPKIIKLAATPYIGKFLTMHTKRFLKLTTNVGASKTLDKEIAKCYLLPYKTRARRKAIWDFVDDIPFENSDPSYANMLEIARGIPNMSHVPVQIIWGLKDPCFHRQMLNDVAALFPQARVHELPDASHLVLEDEPELVTNKISNFLELPLAEAQQATFSETVKDNDNQVGEVNALYAALNQAAESALYTYAAIEPSYLIDQVKYRQINFMDLKRQINKYQRGLTRLGLEANDKVLMLVSPGEDFLALSFAVMGRGAIPVFMDPGMGKENLFKSIEELNPDGVIMSPKAYLVKLLKPKIFGDLKFQIITSEWWLGKGASLSYLKKFVDQPLPQANSNGTVLIAYTSGGTGQPKGVVYDNEMIQALLVILKEEFGLVSGKTDLPLLPIFSLFNAALGVSSVFPPMNPSKPLDLDPLKITQIINDLRIEHSFGSPTLWRKISEYCLRSRTTLESMEKIFMAGAPVPAKTIKLLKEVAPNANSYTPYGATEALPTTLISGEEILSATIEAAKTTEQGTLVGRPVKGVEIKIIKPISEPMDISNCEEVGNYEVGEVIVKGLNISKQYFNLPEVNKLSKITDHDSFWHCIGDMGYLTDSGNLYFCGRKAHLVAAEDITYYSEPCENVFNQHEQVYRSALVQLADSAPAIVIEPLSQHWPETSDQRQKFVRELKALGEEKSFTKSIQRFFFHPSFPVDGRHNAKIFRDKLGVWASEQDQQLKAG